MADKEAGGDVNTKLACKWLCLLASASWAVHDGQGGLLRVAPCTTNASATVSLALEDAKTQLARMRVYAAKQFELEIMLSDRPCGVDQAGTRRGCGCEGGVR